MRDVTLDSVRFFLLGDGAKPCIDSLFTIVYVCCCYKGLWLPRILLLMPKGSNGDAMCACAVPSKEALALSIRRCGTIM